MHAWFNYRGNQLQGYLPLLSVILPIAVFNLPGRTRLPSDEGIIILRLNVSDDSTMSSSMTNMFTVVLENPGAKVALIGVEE